VVARSPETLGPVYKTTRCHTQADEAYIVKTMERLKENVFIFCASSENAYEYMSISDVGLILFHEESV
jgi:hypothetical protein